MLDLPATTPATSPASPNPPAAFVVRAGAARHGQSATLFGCCPNDVKVSGQDSHGALALFTYEGRVPGGPPMHVHDSQDEIYFIESGDWIFVVGGAHHRLGPGDTIFLPRRVPHSFAQTSDLGRLVFMFTPAGDMADFFDALSDLDGPPDPQTEAALFAAHGMQVVGPPIQLE